MYGNIKNCPLMSESTGNIYELTQKETLEIPGFKNIGISPKII